LLLGDTAASVEHVDAHVLARVTAAHIRWSAPYESRFPFVRRFLRSHGRLAVAAAGR
jgi:hypothetical protein